MKHLIGILLWGLSTAATADFKRCTGAEKAGERCLIGVSQVHPTQFSVGKITADCKRGKLEKKSHEELRAFMFEAKRHIPAYISYDGHFFASDKHHLLYALYHAKTPQWQGKHLGIVVRIIANYNYLNPEIFWQSLKDQQQVWVYDEKGDKATDYPEKLFGMYMGDLKDDPYRTLSRWVRKNCGYIKRGNRRCEKLNATKGRPQAPYFLEQYWALYLKKHFNDPSSQTIAQLQEKLPMAIDAALDKEASGAFFKTLGLKAEDYGQNQTGEYSAKSFDAENCE